MTAAVEEIPESADELTAQWLSLATGWAITSVRHEMLGQGQGFLGDIVRLHIETDSADAPGSAIDAGRGQEMMARWRVRLEARLQRVDVNTLL